uniref:Uncharacterized protein n=1 Tax=Zea mays TaxID=4577 RepID=C0P3D5_MAIZE|nr:unknown [Zea mays]
MDRSTIHQQQFLQRKEKTRKYSTPMGSSAAAAGDLTRGSQSQHPDRSRVQCSPVRAAAPPVERLVVGVALLGAAEQPSAAPGLAPAAVGPRRHRHLHRLAPPARRALAVAPRRPRPDQRLRRRRPLAVADLLWWTRILEPVMRRSTTVGRAQAVRGGGRRRG